MLAERFYVPWYFTISSLSAVRPLAHVCLGTGLGLALSQKLSSLMGGDAFATSVEGEGSTFYFFVRIEPDEVCVGVLLTKVPVCSLVYVCPRALPCSDMPCFVTCFRVHRPQQQPLRTSSRESGASAAQGGQDAAKLRYTAAKCYSYHRAEYDMPCANSRLIASCVVRALGTHMIQAPRPLLRPIVHSWSPSPQSCIQRSYRCASPSAPPFFPSLPCKVKR